MTDALSGLAKYQHNLASRKHQDIVIAATHVFLKQGYDGATVDAVAQQASVSLATLYKHFPTKADLYGAALGNVVSQLAAQAPHPSASSDPVKALTALGKAYGELLLDPQTLGFLRLIIAEQTRFPELGAEMYERGKLVAQGPVHAYLEAALKAGELSIPKGVDAAGQFHAMIEHGTLMPALLLGRDRLGGRPVTTIAREAARTFVARFGKAA